MRLYYRLSSTYHDYNSNYVVDPTCQTAKNLPANCVAVAVAHAQQASKGLNHHRHRSPSSFIRPSPGLAQPAYPPFSSKSTPLLSSCLVHIHMSKTRGWPWPYISHYTSYTPQCVVFFF